MIETPKIAQTDELLTAALHVTVPRAEIQKAMGAAIQELMDTLAAQGVEPAGPLLTHHFQRPVEVFDFEACLPVAAPITETDKVKNGHLRAARVARTIYRGPYDGLPAAWGEFMAWIGAEGLRFADDLWEVYVVNLSSGLPPEEWQTELNAPLVG